MKETMGERIKKILHNSGLSIPKFARLTGVSKNTLINYRDGTTAPHADFLEKICQEFKVNPRWLLLGEGEPYESENAAEGKEYVREGREESREAGETIQRYGIHFTEDRERDEDVGKFVALGFAFYRTSAERDNSKPIEEDHAGLDAMVLASYLLSRLSLRELDIMQRLIQGWLRLQGYLK